MPHSVNAVDDLDFWLQHIAAVHPREIELGLERIRAVAQRMELVKPARHVVIVAGTNGKGSTVAGLEALLECAGYRTAAYTSPHIHHFNERVRIGRAEVADRQLCAAFACVEANRGEISLSYFEFATLAALWLFNRSELDVAILEVGLGGRLDAVNIVEADLVVITNISLDHQDWLGADLESIAAEKAGVIRPMVPVVYGDSEPRMSIVNKARQLQSPLLMTPVDCRCEVNNAGSGWTFTGQDATGAEVLLQDLPVPGIALCNAVLAIQAMALLPVQFDVAAVRTALGGLQVAGRFEPRIDTQTGRKIIFDVAHNRGGAAHLAEGLLVLRRNNPAIREIAVVMAVMADKDIEEMVEALESCLDICYIAQVDEPRCMPVDEAYSRLERLGYGSVLRRYDNAVAAYRAACRETTDEDLVVVTGSFFTVAATRNLSKAKLEA
ncbi:MAG: bifunctional tetrahydrofolate synthase/dihydrofolate synthase [Proteobacteria bacterium]|nr:bifunctional tetrahydrofolate synthase/dihydrofolate synthase [Pseudomonadota bacterium]